MLRCFWVLCATGLRCPIALSYWTKQGQCTEAFVSASPSSRHCPGSLDKGATGTVVAVSATNSIVGGKTGDQVGSGGITVLANGNYVVRSEFWYTETVK